MRGLNPDAKEEFRTVGCLSNFWRSALTLQMALDVVIRRQKNGQSTISEAQTRELFILLELEEDIKWPEDKDGEDYLKQVILEELL